MTLLESIAPFVSDVGQTISAQDLILIRNNVALVDQLTYRITPTFDSSAGIDTGTAGFGNTSNSPYGTRFRIWKGAFRFQTGATTLTIAGYARRSTTGGSNEVIKIYVNGVFSVNVTPAAATYTQTIALSGFTDGQVVSVELFIDGSTYGNDGYFVTYAVYISPITYSVTSYPGVPTFTSTFSAAKLNQLVAAYTWVYNRIAVIPNVPGLRQMYAMGPFNLAMNRNATFGAPMYFGSVLRGYTQDSLNVFVHLINETTPGVCYKVLLNGALVYTSSTFGPGTWLDQAVISLTSIAVGVRAEVSVFAKVITESDPNVTPWKFTRWNIAADSQPDYASAVTYPYAALTSPPVGDVTITDATLNTFLNNLASAVDAAKTRIDANTVIFARSYAMRQWYASRDDHLNQASMRKRARPRQLRLGDRLFVKGKDLKINFGPVSVPSDEEGQKYDDYTWANDITVVDPDKTDETVVYLDSMAGLFPGTVYQIFGPVVYAEERL